MSVISLKNVVVSLPIPPVEENASRVKLPLLISLTLCCMHVVFLSTVPVVGGWYFNISHCSVSVSR